MEEQTQEPAQPVEAQQPTGQSLTPHRGTVILILGILGLAFSLFGCLCCVLLEVIPLACGIIAWVMGKKDLKEMAAGSMDPSGQGLTHAGKICGIISVILAIILIVVQLVFVLIFLVLPLLIETRQGY